MHGDDVSADDLNPSELGTKQYWHSAYELELKNFHEIGDVGEIWFGETSQNRVIRWIERCEKIARADRVLDLGCGNGMLLLELAQAGYQSLTGVDYCPGAITLAQEISIAQGFPHIDFQVVDILHEDSDSSPNLQSQYKVCVDKGTYDAISLCPEKPVEKRRAYIHIVERILVSDGYFILVSCNWSRDELLQHFSKCFLLHDEIKAPVLQFGGQQGSTVTTLIFIKKPS